MRMTTILQLFASAVVLWLTVLMVRVNRALLRHHREWVVYAGSLVLHIPDLDEQHQALQRGHELMTRHVREMEAIRAWPLPVRIPHPASGLSSPPGSTDDPPDTPQSPNR
jgi:hypothetical protein